MEGGAHVISHVLYAAVILASIVGFLLGVFYRKKFAEKTIGSAEEKSKQLLEEAQKTAENIQREALLEAKEEILRNRNELEKEIKQRRMEIQRLERRLIQKEESLDRKYELIEKKEEELEERAKEVQKLQEETNAIYKKQLAELERISGLSVEDAKEYLLKVIEDEVKVEAAHKIKKIEEAANEEAERRAKEIIATAIQKCAADHATETTVSVVALPNDEMKGRIIGREGRNIRTLETLTGVDLIIDDTPEAVILSGFDPIKREIARLALEKLILDCRIHPARIEETVDKARKEVENTIRLQGEHASLETGVHGLHPELIKLLGKLSFRTSFGQNVLKHSIEVAHLAGIMAAELGEDISLAKRAGLLHDIGKAVDHEVEGSHVSIGADLARKYKESNDVIHAILAHHGDIEPSTIIAVLVQAADSISAARPGARRETLESYIKRLQKLEEIANSFDEVEKSFAIQAGREIRIMVKPENVTDEEMVLIARNIVKRIENELDYPGQIKVNVIRETRVIEYAK